VTRAVTRIWLLLMALANAANGRSSELIAFSRDGSQALMESSDRDREEGGSRTKYVVIGGGETVEAMLSDRISRGSGARQHQSAADCKSQLNRLRKALRGFDITLNAAGCNKDLRDDILKVGARVRAHTEVIGAGQPLDKHGTSLSSDGQKLILTRNGTAVVELSIQLKGPVGAILSPTGRLLLVFNGDEEEGEYLAAIAGSKSGKLEDLVLQNQK
jgi:hypothetical protein